MNDTRTISVGHEVRLTSGVEERVLQQVCKASRNPGEMIAVEPMPKEVGNIYYWKPYWHETKEEAITCAEQMRIKKIESLKKQIAKLEKMRFE